ncbi:TOMM precursor leader peptide-binding protein [Sphingomonas sp. 28-63-12]|uniref:TOMM precursor leader peptide-binding protein n=1 Tax=Sphingomonas sp. 28-63-12 TaxID=1970434 RepID=UPI000BDD34A2|nr:MAG: hypothetical protein B7Y47_11990 [Sphingomonas sp. 28-63-12]
MRIDLAPAAAEPLVLLDVQAAPFDTGYVLKRGITRVFLEAAGLEAVLAVLADLARREGGATAAELIAAVDEGDRPIMESLIEALKSRRLLVSVADGADNSAEADDRHESVFYWNYGTSPAAVRGTLASRRLSVMGVNHIGTALAAALGGMGFGTVELVDHPMLRNIALAMAEGKVAPIDYAAWAEAEEMPDCLILTADFGGPDLAREWNDFCVANDLNFYPVLLCDQIGMIGPMVLPGRSACYECVGLRDRSASSEISLQRATDNSAYFAQHATGFLAPMAHAAANLAATELLKFYSQALPGGNIGRLIELDLLTPSLVTRRVLKVPRCPVCATARSAPSPAAESNVFMPGND